MIYIFYKVLYSFKLDSLNYLLEKDEMRHSDLKTKIFDMLPDVKTFSNIINHFYLKENNIIILHQLFLIGIKLNYDDEVGNREMMSCMRNFVSDLTLNTKTIDEYYLNTLDLDRMNFKNTQPDEAKEQLHQPITEQQIIKNSVEKMLLPATRKFVHTFEDLLEYSLKIILKIHSNHHNQLFTTIMEIIHEIGEPLELDLENNLNISILKTNQKQIIDQIKEKISIIAELEVKKKKEGKNKMIIVKEILNEQNNLTRLDEELFEITEIEKNILIRQNKLFEFLIKYCKVNPQSKKIF
jgi:hypothetical protein